MLGILPTWRAKEQQQVPAHIPSPCNESRQPAPHRLSYQLRSSSPEGEAQELWLEKEQPASLLGVLCCAAELCSIPAPWRR